MLFSFYVYLPTIQAQPAKDTEGLFAEIRDRLYQIKLIERKSGETRSFGSGFQISADGHIATNYHVVSEWIHKPGIYRIECVDENQAVFPLILLEIDIIHDLAILQCEQLKSRHLTFRRKALKQGAKIFSCGNPYDLNMTIVEGKFSGFLKDRMYESILFSGALNPGMSGGPVVDGEGEVIGMNVSTAYNSIGFLVPVRFLEQLLGRTLKVHSESEAIFKKRIKEQLQENQNRFISDLLSSDWQLESYGDALVPRFQKFYIKGWGNTENDKQKKYNHSYSIYKISDDIFVSSSLKTSWFSVRYDWLETDQLNSIQFYNQVEKAFNGYLRGNKSNRKNHSSYKKKIVFLRHAKKDWKVALGIRDYAEYNGLYDLNFKMVSLFEKNRALLIGAHLAGVDHKNGSAFIKKLMEKIQWRN